MPACSLTTFGPERVTTRPCDHSGGHVTCDGLVTKITLGFSENEFFDQRVRFSQLGVRASENASMALSISDTAAAIKRAARNAERPRCSKRETEAWAWSAAIWL